jgi:uncharacterized protein with ParB-like and HNH nuclease domain
MNNLDKQIAENAKKINTTEYKMSIGEIINLYKEKEVVIDPDFQRIFRWDIIQKSRLIESILVGIPLPSIFIQQRNDGVWDIIDGLQRLSTILEFTGELSSNGEPKKEITLKETELLPNLKECTYNDLSKETKLIFKRFALNLVILKKESDPEAKYELFDRLNSGSKVNEQEIRQAVYRHKKKQGIELIEELSGNNDFQNLISVSDKRLRESFDKELVLRFFALSYCPNKFKEYGGSVKTFLDKYLVNDFDEEKLDEYRNKFTIFFRMLSDIKVNKSVFHGKNGFSIAKYEAIILGLVYNPEPPTEKTVIKEKTSNFSSEQWFADSITKNSFMRKRLDLYLKDNNVINFFSGVKR